MKFPIESEWDLVLEPDNEEARGLLADHMFEVLDALIELEETGGGVVDADLSLCYARMSALFTFTVEVAGESPSVLEVQGMARSTLRTAIHAARGETRAEHWEGPTFLPCRLTIVSEDELEEDDEDCSDLVNA